MFESIFELIFESVFDSMFESFEIESWPASLNLTLRFDGFHGLKGYAGHFCAYKIDLKQFFYYIKCSQKRFYCLKSSENYRGIYLFFIDILDESKNLTKNQAIILTRQSGLGIGSQR